MTAAAFWSVIVAGALPLCTPVILAALGELVLEETGLFNVGIEGIMLIGAAFGVLGSLWGGVSTGLATGAASGALLGGGFGIAVLTQGVAPVIAGIALDVLGGGLSTVLYQILAPAGGVNRTAPTLPPMQIPGLAALPVIGQALASAGPVFYGACAAAITLRWALRRTRMGLRLRAVGQAAQAAEMRGIAPRTYRLGAAIFAGAAAGLAGASIPLGGIGTFTPGMTGGAGFIALAVVIIARRDPIGIIAGAFLFAFFNSLALLSQLRDVGLAVELCQALPYAATLGLLCLASLRRSARRTHIAAP